VNIQVGLYGASPGWQLLLEQEGVSFLQISRKDRFEDFSAIILGTDLGKESLEEITNYLKSGGSVLVPAQTFAQISDSQVNVIPVGSFLPKENSIFYEAGLLDVFTQCYLPKKANELHSLDKKPTALVAEWNGGNIIVLPFDPGEIVLDSRTDTKSFYSLEKRLPFENVSLVSKGALRKLVSRSLEFLHHRRGLPYIHKWYYPNNDQSLFAFRIDTDGGDKESIEHLYALSRKNNIPFTWFVDVKSQEQHFDVYTQMEEQEINIHCYEHVLYDEQREVTKDIEQAKSIFKKHSIQPNGYASPYGTWNPAIAKAIADSGFEYSSEFSYDYDNVPSFPVLEGSPTQQVQIPIHPISIGTLKRLAYSDEMMIEYFKNVIRQTLAMRLPVILYHHPKDGHEDVVQEIFDFVLELKIQPVLFYEYAEWWKARHTGTFVADYTGGALSFKSEIKDPSIRVHITKPDGMETFMPLNRTTISENIIWKKKPDSIPYPKRLSRIRKYNPWISIIRSQDATIGKIKKMYIKRTKTSVHQ